MSIRRCAFGPHIGCYGVAMPHSEFCVNCHEAVMDWNASVLFGFGVPFISSFMFGVTRYELHGYSKMSEAVSRP